MIAQILSTCFMKQALKGDKLVRSSRVFKLQHIFSAAHSQAAAATYLCIRGVQIPLQHAKTGKDSVQGLDDTPLTYVDTLPALEALASELASASEVAVDLEAHSYRSFQGFCCLMQISTRQADYLVDVITLRSAIGPCLGPLFADAKACTHSL